MTQKVSNKTVDLDNTKITSLIHYRSGQMSDATRLLRKEEFLKKKLKSILDINATLEKQIKINQIEIKDQRSGISFQLNDLLKELSIKFQLFTEEQLERTRFKTNQISHSTIQLMMQKYQKIEQESQLLKKICESLDSIHSRYQAHSKEMEQLVISLQESNKEYEQNMQNSLNDINQQIKKKIFTNQRIDAGTQVLVKEIDGFVEGVGLFKQEESKMVGKIEKLKKMAMKQQQKVNEIQEWAQIIIDKNNRQVVYKTLNQKQEDLMKLKINNNQLQIYLKQLQAQQKMLNNSHSKQNTIRPKSVKSSKVKPSTTTPVYSRMMM